MATFRVHYASGEKIDVDAERPAEAGKKAMEIREGIITKIKRVKEASNAAETLVLYTGEKP